MKCKICGAQTHTAFTAIIRGRYEAAYYECPECRFLCTEPQEWLEEAYRDPITNEDTGLVSRNLACAKVVSYLTRWHFGSHGSYLDYAGGYGLLVRLLRDEGIAFDIFEPNCPNLFARQWAVDDISLVSQPYELVTAFEVVEHLTAPMADLSRMFKVTDSLLFTTKLLPLTRPIDQKWSYFGYDHGQHVSFYSSRTIERIAAIFGKKYLTDGGSFHMLTSKKFFFNPLRLYHNTPSALYSNAKYRLSRYWQRYVRA